MGAGDQLPVVLEDHSGTVAHFQSHLRNILDVGNAVEVNECRRAFDRLSTPDVRQRTHPVLKFDLVHHRPFTASKLPQSLTKRRQDRD